MIKLIISDGGNTVIPNLVGLSKSDALSKCNSANIKCTFEGSGTKVVSQSMFADSTVPVNTSIVLTLGE